MDRQRASAVALAVVSALVAVACDSRQLPPGPGTAGTHGTNTGTAGTGDVGGRGGQTPRCELSEEYVWNDQYIVRLSSGATGWSKVTTLSPPSGFGYHDDELVNSSTTTSSCAMQLPPCGDPYLDVSDIEAAIANPDVQAALAQTPSPQYGPTEPVADVPDSYIFQHGGRVGFAGRACIQGHGCNTPPPGVAALMDLLRALVAQQVADPSCAPTGGGGQFGGGGAGGRLGGAAGTTGTGGAAGAGGRSSGGAAGGISSGSAGAGGGIATGGRGGAVGGTAGTVGTGGAIAGGGRGGGVGGGGGTASGCGGAGTCSDGRACPCSRRPGERNLPECPLGSGKVVSVAVGPAGATIDLAGTSSTLGVSFQLVIPYGALQQTTTIQITESTVPPPAPYVDNSPLYDLQPAGLALAFPAHLRIPISNYYGTPIGRIPSEMGTYASTDGGVTYAKVADSYLNAGFTQGSISTLGKVFAGYPRGPADDQACAAAGN